MSLQYHKPEKVIHQLITISIPQLTQDLVDSRLKPTTKEGIEIWNLLDTNSTMNLELALSLCGLVKVDEKGFIPLQKVYRPAYIFRRNPDIKFKGFCTKEKWLENSEQIKYYLSNIKILANYLAYKDLSNLKRASKDYYQLSTRIEFSNDTKYPWYKFVLDRLCIIVRIDGSSFSYSLMEKYEHMAAHTSYIDKTVDSHLSFKSIYKQVIQTVADSYYLGLKKLL